MIFRTVKDHDNLYVKINVTAANDPRLSYKALGIHTYLMTKPDGWEAREADMAKRHNDGVASVRSGVKELIEYGYMIRTRVINSRGQVVDWRIDTFETPDLNPHYRTGGELPAFVDETVDEPDTAVSCPDCENHDLARPDCGFPHVENPQVDYPHVENRTCSNNRVLVITDESDDRGERAESSANAPAPAFDLKSHPAIQAFFDLHNRYPSTAQMKIIVERDPPIGAWVRAIRAWAAAGYKTGNVQGMLDWAFDPGRGEVRRSLFELGHDRGPQDLSTSYTDGVPAPAAEDRSMADDVLELPPAPALTGLDLIWATVQQDLAASLNGAAGWLRDSVLVAMDHHRDDKPVYELRVRELRSVPWLQHQAQRLICQHLTIALGEAVALDIVSPPESENA